ncbi:hypothetical protein J6590_095871 [Homalodisca vitripennis]|nr:hypothetical protein J6590_095871 [Homalodisca vitripennis]
MQTDSCEGDLAEAGARTGVIKTFLRYFSSLRRKKKKKLPNFEEEKEEDKNNG